MESRVLLATPDFRRKVWTWGFTLLAFLTLLLPTTALAQPSGMCDGCTGMMGGGMGGMMWPGMIIAWLLGLSAIAALIAVTVYLVRRSKL